MSCRINWANPGRCHSQASGTGCGFWCGHYYSDVVCSCSRLQTSKTHARTHTHTYARTHTHARRTHVHTHTHAHMHTYACMHARTHTPARTCTHAHTYKRTHARTRVHTHTRTHTYICERVADTLTTLFLVNMVRMSLRTSIQVFISSLFVITPDSWATTIGKRTERESGEQYLCQTTLLTP